MSDKEFEKEFEEWLVKYHDKYPMPYPSVNMYNRKDMEKCWQESARRATEAERKRSVDILEARYYELSQLKTDDNSNACWEDYNYSQKEIARLLKSLK